MIKLRWVLFFTMLAVAMTLLSLFTAIQVFSWTEFHVFKLHRATQHMIGVASVSIAGMLLAVSALRRHATSRKNMSE